MNLRAGERGLFLCNQFTEAASTMPGGVMEVANGRMRVGKGVGKRNRLQINKELIPFQRNSYTSSRNIARAVRGTLQKMRQTLFSKE